MYKYNLPTPIIIKLTDNLGFELRQKAAEYIKENLTKGAERGSSEEQGFGALAEIVIRNKLEMPEINPKDHPLGYDILLPSRVKLDIKCRGGKLPFQEYYIREDGIPREAKHNFFARQIYDKRLDTDIYLMTHLETPENRILPGTLRQKKWILYVCGWVSKERVLREGVYLPRGSLTEQGKTWFTYRGQEIEFYNRNLNGFNNIIDLLTIDKQDVEKDSVKKGDLNLTTVDAMRIAYDLVGRGVLSEGHLDRIKKELDITKQIEPIFHPNQYYHFIEWLTEKEIINETEEGKIARIMIKKKYEGI